MERGEEIMETIYYALGFICGCVFWYLVTHVDGSELDL